MWGPPLAGRWRWTCGGWPEPMLDRQQGYAVSAQKPSVPGSLVQRCCHAGCGRGGRYCFLLYLRTRLPRVGHPPRLACTVSTKALQVGVPTGSPASKCRCYIAGLCGGRCYQQATILRRHSGTRVLLASGRVDDHTGSQQSALVLRRSIWRLTFRRPRCWFSDRTVLFAGVAQQATILNLGEVVGRTLPRGRRVWGRWQFK